MFISIVNASIAASWLILAVIVLRLALKKAPRWITCVLWGVVGLRLVLPFSLESIFSLLPSGQTIPDTIEYDAVPQISSGVSPLDGAVNPILSEHFAATPQYSANPIQILIGIAQYLWYIGMAVMVLYLIISYIVLRVRMRTATRLRDNIMQSEQAASPFVMGIIRPRIYLPYDMDVQDASHVIAHEQAHIARGDHIVKPLAFLLLTVHWFNPLVWAAYILLCRDIETACDERVIRELDTEGRKDYSRALVHGSTRRTAAACPLAFGEAGVKARIKSVLSYKKPALWIIIAAAAACVVVAVCFLTDPVEQHDIFGRQYVETELVYESPLLSSIATPDGVYELTADRRLVELTDSGSVNVGRLSAITLTRDNFDDYFHDNEISGWQTDTSAAALRRANQSAWRLVGEDSVMYYILAQNDGTVYIAFGSYDPEGETDPASDDSQFLRIFRLKENLQTLRTTLDEVIDKAVMEHHYGSYRPGDFACTAHSLRAVETETIDEHTERLTAYAIVLYLEYDLVDGVPEEVSGSNIPVAITFDITDDCEYTLVEYWEPESGTLYVTSLREKYPSGVSWDTQLDYAQCRASCFNQACRFFGVSASTTTAGGADEPALTTTTTVVVESRRYVYTSPEQFFGVCCLTLNSDGTGELTFGMLSSYIAWGTWKTEGDYIVLSAEGNGYKNDEGKYVTVYNKYYFRPNGSAMIFCGDLSADIPSFGTGAGTEAKPVFTHGCAFVEAADGDE